MSLIDCLPHQPPMRLVEEIVEIHRGESATGRRIAKPDDFYFQGHFPGDPIVPAVILVEMLAQAERQNAGYALRIHALSPWATHVVF